MDMQKLACAARIFREADKGDVVSFLLKADAPYLIKNKSGAKIVMPRGIIAGLSAMADAFGEEDRSLDCMGLAGSFNLEGIISVEPWPVEPDADLISLDRGEGAGFGNYAIGKSCMMTMTGQFSVVLLESHVNCLNHGNFHFQMDARAFADKLAELADVRLE